MSEKFSKILLDSYLQGESQAAADVYARYAPRLLKLARSRIFELIQSKVDPQDIAQEAFVAFFDLVDEGKVDWQKEGDLWRLLSGIAINQVY